MRALLTLDATDPRVRRLYPAAYADDAEKEEEYRELTHEELRSSRLANVDAVEASIEADGPDRGAADRLDAGRSTRSGWCWARSWTSTTTTRSSAFDPDDPEARTQALYGYLGGLLDEIVDAQLEVL